MLLDDLADHTVPERVEAVRGLVAFDVDGTRHLLVYDGSAAPARTATGDPDVVLTTTAADLARWVGGEVTAAVLLLSNRLAAAGDADLALAVGGTFRKQGTANEPVDPADVDPEEIAGLLKRVPDRHLRAVMTGDFRDVVLDQVFARLPDFLDERKAKGHMLSVGFTVTGRPDGDADRWTVHVEQGEVRVERGDAGRDATITADGADFLKLVTGHLSPMTGVIRGRLKVRGELAKALTLHKIMRIPGT